ncbi:MAG: chorismate synthase [Candidatus Cloacimonetes bacterium]|nr:chorismate synthase [Candidatus Cloacimonadota bacterium]
MASNSFGLIYRFTSFGESHGDCLGVILDGVPSNFPLDLTKIQADLDRRKPGQNKLMSQRKEDDDFELVSGYFEGKTTGTPLTFLVRNKDQKSRSYTDIVNLYRPGHADYTYHKKYKNYNPYGGGRSSARETLARVIAGSVAKQFLETFNISIEAQLTQVGDIKGSVDLMHEEILRVKKLGNSIGGKIEVRAKNIPVGVGEPIYEKLDARLAYAFMSINAVKAVEIGDGVEVVTKMGSENNDVIRKDGRFESNHSGGILGGISTGQDLLASVSIKPTPSIFVTQDTINKNNEEVQFDLKGRHDPCVALRAPVIIEAMMAQVVFDLMLLDGSFFS